MATDEKPIANETISIRVMANQTIAFRKENNLDEETASALLNKASHDKRYLNYCKTKATTPEHHKFVLMLATMIIMENKLKEFQLETKLSDLEIKTLTDITKGDRRYLDFCTKNPNFLDRKKYAVSLTIEIFKNNPNILHSFCIRTPTRRLIRM